MKYFVTGATGFIGGQVALQLRREGHEVHALVRGTGRGENLSAQGVHLFVGDITQKDTLRAPMEEVDGVFHVAGWYHIGTKDRRTAFAVNVDGTRNVLETMKELGVRKLSLIHI